MVNFPSHIAISNPRLNLVFLWLMCTFAGLNIAVIVGTRAYLQPLGVATRLYVKPAESQELAINAIQEHSGDSICTSVRCVPQGAHVDSTFYAESASQVLVLTSWSDEQDIQQPVDKGRSRRLAETVSNGPSIGDVESISYVPSADVFALVFEYDLDMLETQTTLITRLFPQPGSQEGFRANHASTVILDGHKQPWRTLLPGEPVHLTSSEILFLSEGALDVLADEPPTSTNLPTMMRMKGAEVRGRVDCFGSDADLAHYLQPGVVLSVNPTLTSPVCMLQFDFAAMGSSSKQILSTKGGGHTMNLSRGLRVRCERGAGAFSVISVFKLFSMFTNTVVILSIPRSVLLFFACYGLGHLSTIYKQAIFAPFDIRDEVAGVAARIAAHSACFVELADTDLPAADTEGLPSSSAGGNECKRGMSKSRLRERLHDVLQFRSSELNRQEVDHLASFAFHQMLHAGQHVSTATEIVKLVEGDFADVKDKITSNKNAVSFATDSKLAVDIDAFSCSCSSLEHLGFDSFVKLFDKDRPRYYLERLFTPRALNAHIELTRDTSNSSGAGEPTSPGLKKRWQHKQLNAMEDFSTLLNRLEERLCKHQSHVSGTHATFSDALARQEEQLEKRLAAHLEEFRVAAEEKLESVRAEMKQLSLEATPTRSAGQTPTPQAPETQSQLALASPPSSRTTPEALEALAQRLEMLALRSPSLAMLSALESRVGALEGHVDTRQLAASLPQLSARSASSAQLSARSASSASVHLGSSLRPLPELSTRDPARGSSDVSAGASLPPPPSDSWEAQLRAFSVSVGSGLRRNAS